MDNPFEESGTWYDDIDSSLSAQTNELKENYANEVFKDLILDPSFTLELSTDSTGTRVYWSFVPVDKNVPVLVFGNFYSGLSFVEVKELGFDA